eukprot:scaffold706_cov418-Prasinococcus_capsulatus_cf.AAC.12
MSRTRRLSGQSVLRVSYRDGRVSSASRAAVRSPAGMGRGRNWTLVNVVGVDIFIVIWLRVPEVHSNAGKTVTSQCSAVIA